MAEPIMTWTAPAPFWEGVAIDQATAAQALGKPEILRFAKDEFMDELLTALAHDPHSIRNLAVRHETWRGPEEHTTGLEPELLQERRSRLALLLGRKRALKARRASGGTVSLDQGKVQEEYRLKLYQPAHQRYYLVSSSLVCSRFGFPDRVVDPGQQERVSYVLRRLLPTDPAGLDPTEKLPPYDPAHPKEWQEYAFVARENGAEWRQLPPGQTAPLGGEERLPLFPLRYATGEERNRRILAGLIPVGRREAYMGAPPVVPPTDAEKKTAAASDPRLVLLQTQVLAPWKALVDRVGVSPADWVRAEHDPDTQDVEANRQARAQMQTATWYILLDLAKFLTDHVHEVWAAIAEDAAIPHDSKEKQALFDALKGVFLSQDVITALVEADYPFSFVVPTLTEALRNVVKWEDELDKVTRPFDFTVPPHKGEGWPDFLFVLADPWFKAVLPQLEGTPNSNDTQAQQLQRKIDALAELFEAALDQSDQPQVAKPTIAASTGLDMRQGWFVIRCVYERPECGPLDDVVVSAPTRAFQFAAFFDPDAPARPVRIGLPIDTTPGGLRKFDKNTVFMISDILCGQISRMKGLTFGDLVRQVLPWPLHKNLSMPEKGPCQQADGLSLGMMCSLSIPIITLCALILLMIMVNLLDFIFRWLPFFQVCFPLPGFKGKKE